jgi:hypothetical protein
LLHATAYAHGDEHAAVHEHGDHERADTVVVGTAPGDAEMDDGNSHVFLANTGSVLRIIPVASRQLHGWLSVLV